MKGTPFKGKPSREEPAEEQHMGAGWGAELCCHRDGGPGQVGCQGSGHTKPKNWFRWQRGHFKTWCVWFGECELR